MTFKLDIAYDSDMNAEVYMPRLMSLCKELCSHISTKTYEGDVSGICILLRCIEFDDRPGLAWVYKLKRPKFHKEMIFRSINSDGTVEMTTYINYFEYEFVIDQSIYYELAIAAESSFEQMIGKELLGSFTSLEKIPKRNEFDTNSFVSDVANYFEIAL